MTHTLPRRILAVQLVNWPIDRFARRSSILSTARTRAQSKDLASNVVGHWKNIGPLKSQLDPSTSASTPALRKPTVLIQSIANRQLVIAANDAARATGIAFGMTLAHARALCTDLTHADHDEAKDAKALQGLARWLIRFTPAVSINNENPICPSLFLDLTGCERIFGGIKTLLQQITHAFAKLKITASFAIAPTPGAAWALSFAGKNAPIIEESQLQKALADLPPAALRIDHTIAATLHHLGIVTISQLMKLPRESLPSRFGPTLLKRLDQAFGSQPEPLVPIRPDIPIESKMEFEGAVESLEVIWLVFKELIARVIVDLTRRGCGARQIQIDFIRPDAPSITKTIQLSRPSRDPSNLFNLFRCATEKLQADECSALADGFVGVHLKIPVFEKLDHEQIQLLEHEQYTGQRDLDRLVERLCIRLGPQSVIQPALVEAHLPERAWKKSEVYQTAKANLQSITPSLHRPLHLSRMPTEISVMVTPFDQIEGKPVLFNDRGKTHNLIHVIGPERIAGPWWDGRNKTRDYFDVEDTQGERFWLFRVVENSRWFKHGAF